MKTVTKTLLLLTLICCSVTLSAKKKPVKQPETEIEKAIKSYMEDCHTKALSVVLVKGDSILYQGAFGYKDEEGKVPVEINDFYRIASISKSFSGASILQLVDEGKISLSDDINDIMGMNIRNPRYPDIPITVKMLLTHTSSMKDGPGGAARYRDLKYIDESRTDLETIAKQSYNEYAPGMGYKYCNRALNMMGCVIEKVSGERFDNYVLNHILRPMGLTEKEAGYNIDSLDMTHAVALWKYEPKDDSFTCSNEAAYFTRTPQKKLENGTYVLGKDGWGWSPTGGMKISAPNLAKWMMTLRDGGVAPNGTRILSEKAVKTMLTPVTPSEQDSLRYCLTIRGEKRLIPGTMMKGHHGSAQGLKSLMFFDPASDWGVVCIASSVDKQSENGICKIFYKTVNLLYGKFIEPKE